MNILNTSWKAETFHIHFQIKKYRLQWDLTKPQLMGRSTRSSVHKCPPESAQPRHPKGYPQAVHALPSHLAALMTHPTYCKQSQILQRSHSACSKQSKQTLTVWCEAQTQVQVASDRAELAEARTGSPQCSPMELHTCSS